jgi:hypothetical protein
MRSQRWLRVCKEESITHSVNARPTSFQSKSLRSPYESCRRISSSLIFSSRVKKLADAGSSRIRKMARMAMAQVMIPSVRRVLSVFETDSGDSVKKDLPTMKIHLQPSSPPLPLSSMSPRASKPPNAPAKVAAEKKSQNQKRGLCRGYLALCQALN